MVEVVRMGQGDPIVLVPGLAGGWRLLAPLARRLATRHEVILPGLRGDRCLMVGPGPENMAEYAHDLAELIQQLRLERPTVLGVSFGGAVALELAVRYPNLVGALAVQGTEARFRSSLGSMIARRVLERFPLPTDNGFVNQFFNILHGCRPEPGRLPEFVIERIWETDQSVMASRLRALEQFDVSEHLDRISAPTLVLAGTRDVVVPPSRQRAMAEAIPHGRFVSVEGAGHIAFLTHGAEVVRQVRRLLKDRARTFA
jgi:pimeloyl-ACP methyl ester carboxylesterase